MTYQSNVGNRTIYEGNEQRTFPDAALRESQRNREHPPSSSIHSREHQHDEHNPTDEELSKKDPRAPAWMHGNQPSRGAKIDAELRQEDEERLKQKGYK
ncbi:hypothetical protein FQN57_002510 [Myotisia sp. PD_48]|nr:hypothetical protein FQN57_002510 [Myotisia sp. PD_48]